MHGCDGSSRSLGADHLVRMGYDPRMLHSLLQRKEMRDRYISIDWAFGQVMQLYGVPDTIF